MNGLPKPPHALKSLSMTRHFVAFAIVIGIVSLSILGCRTCKESCTKSSAESEMKSYRISLSSFGGFSGQENGIVISSNGIVRRYKHMPAENRKLHIVGAAPIDSVRALRMLFDAEKTFDNDLHGKFNMTTRLVLEEAGTTRTLTWEGSIFDPETQPVSVKSIVSRVLRIAKLAEDDPDSR